MIGVSTVAWKGAKELQRGQETPRCWRVLHMAWRDGCLLMHDKTSYIVHIKYMPHGPYVSGALTHLLGAILHNTGGNLVESHTFQYCASIYNLYREQFCKRDHGCSLSLLLEWRKKSPNAVNGKEWQG